jgi:hypothetical protein
MAKNTTGRTGSRSAKQEPPGMFYVVFMVLLVAILAGIVWFPKEPAAQAFMLVFFKVVGALIPAMILYGILSRRYVKQGEIVYQAGERKRRLSWKWGGSAAFYLGVLGLLLPIGTDAGTFSASILVRDADGRTVLKGRGSIALLLGTDVRREAIDRDGRALFEELPGQYLDKEVKVELESDLWMPVQGHSVTFPLTAGHTVLTVKSKYNVRTVSGQAVAQDGSGIAGATVWLGEGEPVKTDADGRFRIQLPPGELPKTLLLHIVKTGYKPFTLIIYPRRPFKGGRFPLTKEK